MNPEKAFIVESTLDGGEVIAMVVPHNRRVGCALVIACLTVTIVPDCRFWLFYPDQTPGLTLAKKLGGPAEAMEWTLRQSSADEVQLGVSALLSCADPEQQPAPSVEVRLAVLDGLGRVADQLATDWPEGQVHCLSLTPRMMFWHAARVATTLDDPIAAYDRINPSARTLALHSEWREAGIGVGLLRGS
jgi:hypothetical protein